MKHFNILIFFYILPNTIFSTQTSPQLLMPPTPPTMMWVMMPNPALNNVQQPISIHVKTDNKQTVQQSAAQTNSSKNNIQPPQWCNTVLSSLQSSIFLNKNWWYEKRFHIGLISLLALYGWLYVQCRKINVLLKSSSTWSSWKPIYTNAQLMMQPIEILQGELLNDIQGVYLVTSEPTNFVKPLAQFMLVLNDELKQLNSFLSLAHIIIPCNFYSLLPIESNIISVIETRIDRLTFIHHLFTRWATNYKIDHSSER